MPVFEIQSDKGTFQVEAPDQMTAVKALGSYQPEAENSIAGSLKSVAAGLGEGAIDLVGLPADAADLASRGFDAVSGMNTNESVGPAVKPFGSENIKKNVEGVTGEFYKPQTATEKFLRGTASFAPAALAGPGGIARRVATQAIIPGAASEAAGQLTEGTDAEPYARVGGALLGGAAGAKAAQAATKPSLAAVPSKFELDAAKTAGYKSTAIEALEIQPAAVSKFTDKVIGDLKKDRFSEKQAGKTYDAIESLRNPEFGTNHKIADFDATRKILNQIAGDIGNATDAAAAQRAIKAIDVFTLRVPQAAVVAGDARAAGKELFQARGNAAAGFRSERVMSALEKATNSAAATHSGGNFDNEVRKQIRNMLNSPKQMRGFSAEEKKALEKVARGTLLSNTIRKAGKVLGGGGGLGQLASGAAGTAMFGPAGMIAMPALGMGLNKLGSAMTSRRLNKADELIRSRSPMYGQGNQQAYLQAQQGGGLLGNLPPQQAMAMQALIAAHPELVNQ